MLQFLTSTLLLPKRWNDLHLLNTALHHYTESDKVTLPGIFFGGVAATLLSILRFRQLLHALPSVGQNGERNWPITFAWINTSVLLLVGVLSIAILLWFISTTRSRRSFFIAPAFLVVCLVLFLGMQFMNTPAPRMASEASQRGYAIGRFLGLIPWVLFAILLLVAAGMLHQEPDTAHNDTIRDKDSKCDKTDALERE